MPERKAKRDFNDLAAEAARVRGAGLPRSEAVKHLNRLVEERGLEVVPTTVERVINEAYMEPPEAKPADCYVCHRKVPTVYSPDQRRVYSVHGPSPGVFCLAVGKTVADSVLLDPKDPHTTARIFVTDKHLRYQAGIFYRWHKSANAWLAVEDAVIRAEVWKFLAGARKKSKEDHVPFSPTQRAVSEVVDAVKGVVVLPEAQAAPRWLDDRDETTKLIAFPNGLLGLADRRLLPPEPTFYNHIALPFEYDPALRDAPTWQTFLESLWPNDPESIGALQEMFGYMVAGETRFQKIFMLVGPKRGGKGTIARVLRELIGHVNFCAPTLAGLGQHFGSEMLIHKLVAVVSDARITGKTDPAVVAERLLRTSGEDADSIPRKFREAWQGQLKVRFMLLTNMLPRIEDPSSALASRFVILRLTRSFLGKEDLGLFEHLLPELPGILNWSLDGWDRLQARGHFAVPLSAQELVHEFEALGSPIGAFLEEWCDVGAGYVVPRDKLFAAWKQWCHDNERQHVGTKQSFSKDLYAALPGLGRRRIGPRGRQVAHWLGLRLGEEQLGPLAEDGDAEL